MPVIMIAIIDDITSAAAVDRLDRSPVIVSACEPCNIACIDVDCHTLCTRKRSSLNHGPLKANGIMR
jgi:hypothetical protein